jgi:DNA ligase-associated metallophosphoesterase
VPDDLFIELNGEHVVLDPSGALWWPEQSTLIFADIHFEKGSFYALTRQFLPPYDTRTALRRIGEVIQARKPARVIALGDSFHDREAPDRLDAAEREMLLRLGRMADWIWITGNHDPAPPTWLGGFIASEIAFGRLVFRHEPGVLFQRGEVAGHLHPVTTVNRRGRSLRRRCFVSDGRRMVLPAFGAYAGGLDCWDAAIAGLFEGDFGAFMLGMKRVYAVAGRGMFHSTRPKNAEDSQPKKSAIITADNP